MAFQAITHVLSDEAEKGQRIEAYY